MAENDDIAGALADVREAYRLVWAYQRRVLDLVRVVGEAFPTHAFLRGTPIQTYVVPPNNVVPFDRWAWDFLPLYDFSYLYTRRERSRNPEPGDWMLDVHCIADTGFVAPEGGADPDARAFGSAATSETRVDLAAWVCDGEIESWFTAWNDAPDWPEESGVIVMSAEPPLRVVKLSCDLAELGDRAAIHAAVARFKTMARETLNIDVG